jgi:hypothetical protein
MCVARVRRALRVRLPARVLAPTLFVMAARGISAWVAELSDSKPEARARAARAIYEAGLALARTATLAWKNDAQLARLFAGEPTVGVAVQPDTFEKIRGANGMPQLADVPPDQDAREFSLQFLGGISLDILTTRDPRGAGAIARFLNRHGEAIQQVELPVKSVDRAITLLRERFRVDPVYPETRSGADGTRVNFLLVPVPDDAGMPAAQKVLIELVQKKTART